MSILVLFLIVGVALSLHISGHGNSSILQPIILKSQEHRICAELCSAGLGGESCGETCMDIAPQNFPVQSTINRTNENSNDKSRSEACPILCANSLGRPLCDCNGFDKRPEEVDFIQICGAFCIKYGYRINGCQSCDVYKKVSDMFIIKSQVSARMRKVKIDWNQWCLDRCIEGDGGAACNCDILPLRMNF